MERMIFSRDVLPQQVVLLLTIIVSAGAALAYIHRKGRLDSIRPVVVPLFFYAVFGTLDALVTLRGTWNDPWREGNPSLRVFLVWGGWWGQCIGTALWVLVWLLILDGLEVLRRRSRGRARAFWGGSRLLTAYALATGHLYGLLTWIHWPPLLYGVFSAFGRFLWEEAEWLVRISPFSTPLYVGLFFGGMCALTHRAVLAMINHDDCCEEV